MVKYEDLAERRKAVAVVGLGYVGLPLAVALAEHFQVIGFDVSERRIRELEDGLDRTREVEPGDLARADIEFTADPARLLRAGVVLVAVPTPIDGHRTPDLGPVRGASRTVGRNLAPGTVVAYESTVYPGVTEEVCAPILEKESGLKCGQDFFLGYSPERINPGDKEHTLRTIIKVVAGQTDEVTDLLARVYGAVVEAGIHRVSCIRAAEAAKVIENTQRDLNIALMNELAMIFDLMGLDTMEVLRAAGTKWNFLPFRPGLVGGHCIGVDPYYLTFKAESLGYHPQVILAGRRINDNMGRFVAQTAIKKMIRGGRMIKGARVGLLGLTFKENVPDLRNTRVVDLVAELKDFGVEVVIHDPMADPDEAREEYGIDLVDRGSLADLDAVVLAVGHQAFNDLDPSALKAMFKPGCKGLVIDIKGFFDTAGLEQADVTHWRL